MKCLYHSLKAHTCLTYTFSLPWIHTTLTLKHHLLQAEYINFPLPAGVGLGWGQRRGGVKELRGRGGQANLPLASAEMKARAPLNEGGCACANSFMTLYPWVSETKLYKQNLGRGQKWEWHWAEAWQSLLSQVGSWMKWQAEHHQLTFWISQNKWTYLHHWRAVPKPFGRVESWWAAASSYPLDIQLLFFQKFCVPVLKHSNY